MSPLPVIVAILLSGFVAEWLVYLRYRDLQDLLANGQDVDARVTKLRHTTRSTDIRYSFRLPDGSELESRYEGLPDLLHGLKVNDRVKIRYLPRKPKVNYFTDNMERKMLSAKVTFIMPVFGVMILCAPLLLAMAK
jgi:hypothetical protein